MTVGMLIESMSSSVAILEGKFLNANPFLSVPHDVVWGSLSLDSSIPFAGVDALVSGMTGGGIRQGVFLGSVYYQRLRLR